MSSLRACGLRLSLSLLPLAVACQPVEGVYYTDPSRPEAQTVTLEDVDPDGELHRLATRLLDGATPDGACEAAARIDRLVDGVRRQGAGAGPEEMDLDTWRDAMRELERAAGDLRDVLTARCAGDAGDQLTFSAMRVRDALEPLRP